MEYKMGYKNSRVSTNMSLYLGNSTTVVDKHIVTMEN